jgi:hypothetical protein
LNSQTQVSHAWLAQRRVSVFVAGSWMNAAIAGEHPAMRRGDDVA